MKDKDLIDKIVDGLERRLAHDDWGNGRKTITAAGTPERVTDQETPCSGVYLQALSANTGLIYWGRDERQAKSDVGVELDVGAPIWIPINDLSKLWLDAAVNGEGVCWVILE